MCTSDPDATVADQVPGSAADTPFRSRVPGARALTTGKIDSGLDPTQVCAALADIINGNAHAVRFMTP
jgi:hypothetical protein